MRTPPRALALLTVLLLAALAVRLYNLTQQSIWFDEGWSAYAATQPSLGVAAAADATNPPLYYILLNLSTRFLGDSPFALRLFSTFAGLLGVALAYRLARDGFGVRAGLYAAFLSAFSALLWWAAQEARMYTLLALLVLAAALAWQRLVRRPSRGAWALLWLAELALLYTHNTGPVVALWLNVVTLGAWLIRRRLDRPDWRVWLGGQVLVGLLWLPYFITRYLSLTEANSAVQSAPLLSLDLLRAMWTVVWLGNWALVQRLPTFAAVDAATPYVLLSGLALLLTLVAIPWRKPAARWLVLHVVVLTGGLLLGLGVLGNELHGRYLVMIAPLLLVPVGAGLARLRPRALGWAGAAVFGGIFAVAVVAGQNPLYQHDDVVGTVRAYADALGPDDTVLAWSYADRYELAYYWPRLGVQAARVTLPEGADLDAILPLLPEGGDVALNIWYTQRADYRGMLNCVLAHGTRALPEEVTTYGMTSLIYRTPTLSVPALQPRTVDFGVARLLSAGAIPAFTPDRAVCLPLHLQVARTTARDLQAALIARNALGWEVARADAIFATANQRTSSMVAPNTELAAYPLLRLSYGAPAGDYELVLRVYDADRLSGYEVATDAARGRDFVLGTWRAPAGQDWAALDGRYSGLSTPLDLSVGDDLRLSGMTFEADGGTVANGQTLRLTLLWTGSGDIPALTLAAVDGRWAVALPPPGTSPAGVRLDWRDVRIPADASDGDAELRLPDGRVLATVTVEALPFVAEPPSVETAFSADVPAVGALVGFTLGANPATLAGDLPLTLVWQAGDAAPTGISYTVFAQLLDADGLLMAQSDTLPAAGARPTTGWRPGEYLVDAHVLHFNEQAHPGPARLIVGFYDPATGARLALANGSTAIELPVTVDVAS